MMNFRKKLFIVGLVFVTWLVWSNKAFGNQFYITLENDLYHDTDRAYTHGTRVFDLIDYAPSWATNFWPDKDVKFGWGFAQYMYTPSDISIAELIEDDRPYGGWLYIEFLLMARDDMFMDVVGIDIGVTGEEAGSDKTQELVHKYTDSVTPRGWDNQIGTEIGVDLLYQKKYRWRYENVFDVVSQSGGSLGNIYTYVNAGTMVRFGYNIPDNFGALRMEPAARNTSDGFYLFGGAEERYVLRNIFLDGNTFKDSHSVDKEEFVHDLYYGVGISLGNFEIVFSDTYRSKEFKGQDKGNAFSTLILSWKY